MKRFYFSLLWFCVAIVVCAEIPAGYYYKADGKCGYDLLSALNDICSNASFLKYGKGEGYTWEGFHYTDRNEDGSIIDMYSATVRYQTDFNSVDGMHIEHALPKSWWGALENYAFRDLHHLFPADAKTNITKNNLPLGEVVTPSFDNGVSKIGTTSIYNGKVKCFEPNDEYKGDFARAYMYISTIYNEFADIWDSHMMQNNTYPVWNDEAIDLLLKWHRDDPVSEKETKRQEAVYQIQHNRNPFIDYPEMAEHIWGNKKEEGISIETEGRSALITPTAWTEINIPVTYVGTTASTTLYFEGVNFTENLTLGLKGLSSEISLSKSYITPEELLSGYDLTIEISCDTAKTIIDTLLINASDTIELAISVTFSDEFMVTSAVAINPTTAEVNWTALPNAEEYEVVLRDKPNMRMADLIFSAYVEGSSYNKAVSIYNGTGRTVDLKYYSIRKQGNGTGDLHLDYPLSGSLADGECCVIVSNRVGDELKDMADILVKSPVDQDNIINFNGNDAIALYHNGILIDVVGELDNPLDWGKDVSLKRNVNVVSPNTEFDWNEWSKYGKDDFSHLKNHNATKVESEVIDSYVSATNSIMIEGLTPNRKYYAEVLSGNNATTNLLSFTTSHMSAPEAYEATNVYATQFTANWEEVNYADGYVVDLMQTVGNEEVMMEENFDDVGSTGKPLPEGWSGTASGNYTSTASSGKATPSLALKNSGEYIQTPICSSPLTYVEFMYRFPSSSATESYFVVYSVDSQGELTQLDKIEYESTAKKTLMYDDLIDVYAIRIEYHKVAGNLAIDDVIYKYGGSMTKVMRSEETVDNFWVFEGLNANTEYSYRVRAIVGEDYETEVSNVVLVKTNSLPVVTDVEGILDIKIYTMNNVLCVDGLDVDSVVRVYDVYGMKVYQESGKSAMRVELADGVYILQIENGDSIETLKFIIR